MSFLFLIVYVVFGTSPVTAAPQCLSLFQKNTSSEQLSNKQTVLLNLKLFMERFKPQQITTEMVKNLSDSVATLLSDTTGKRIENKVTAEADVVTTALTKFKNSLTSRGLELIDRDKKTPGLRNVTYTEYTRPFFVSNQTLHQMGFEIRPEALSANEKTTVKIRIRSYGTVDESLSSFNIQDIKFADFTKDRAFVEFKFKDPSYEGAVFKPQMYMKKEFIQLFGTKEFVSRFAEIKADTMAHLKISAKKTLDHKSVEAMLQFIYNAHVSKLDLSIAAINLYERSAQSVSLKYNSEKDPHFDKKYGSVENIELQMTFDQLISLYVPEQGYMIGTGQYYRAYAPEQVVSEFKTPTLIAHHLQRALSEAQKANKVGLVVTDAHAKELDQLVPGFKEYLFMINEIIQERDTHKKLNSGKWGIAIKNIAQQLSRQIKELFDSEGLLQ